MTIERRYEAPASPIAPLTPRLERPVAGRGLSKAKRMQLRRLRRLCNVLGAFTEVQPRL